MSGWMCTVCGRPIYRQAANNTSYHESDGTGLCDPYKPFVQFVQVRAATKKPSLWKRLFGNAANRDAKGRS